MNDLFPLGDVDDLRTVLRTRADRAPDPDHLIPTTHRLVRRRQLRRRGTLLGGTVVLTAVALIGTMLLRQADGPIQPSGGPLIPPVFPFSVGPLPDGLRLDGWQSLGDDLTVQPFDRDIATYTGPGANGMIEWLNYDPSLNATGHPAAESTTTVHGVPARIEQQTPDDQYWQLSWQATAQAWLSVIITATPAHSVDESELLAIADAVIPNPSSFPTTLDIAHLPAGFMAFNWRHMVTPGQPAGTEDDVTVCPKGMPKESGESNCFHVLAVRGASGSLTSSVAAGQRLLGGRGFADHSWVAVYATSLVVGVGPAEIDGLLQEVSFG